MDLGWVDIALLSLLGVSVLLGIVRGLTLELLSLVGWIAAYFAALGLLPWLAPHMPVGTPGSGLRIAAAFAAGFLAALIVWALAARLFSLLVKSTPLVLLDRVLGACFGLVRGLVLLLVLATLVSLTPWARSADWRTSTGAVWLNGALGGLAPLLPAALARHLPG